MSRYPLAVDESGALLVAMGASGIPPVYAVAAGLPAFVFDGSSEPYLRVSQVIMWHSDQLENASVGQTGNHISTISAFRECERKLSAGELDLVCL